MKELVKISRSKIAIMHDLFMAAISFPLSLYLRVGDDAWNMSQSYLYEAIIAFVVICVFVFPWSRLYKGIWRYASVNDLVAITKAVTLAILIFLPFLFLYTRLEMVPRSLPIINWFVLMALIGGPRFLYRLFKDKKISSQNGDALHRRIPVLLIGSGDEAELFLRDMKRDPSFPYNVVGLITETQRRVGQEIHKVPVLCTIDKIEGIFEKGLVPQPEKLILTKDHMDGSQVRDLLELTERRGMTMARLPKMSELKSGVEAAHNSIRPVAVEDLLGRPQATLDRPAMQSLVAGKRILVTGSGGTIGSELVRQICDLGPAEINLLDSSEYQLYLIDQEIGLKHSNIPKRAILGDVRDETRINDVFARVKPQLVFHAAALKHVPMVEENPLEGVLTNAIGSRIVADACHHHGVECMLKISTDKAVNPTNVMGATKRIAESYIQALDKQSRAKGSTRYVMVRFGNVLGSTGSVVPLFKRQLEQGGPLTVTHPDITRYFMTVREAVELVLQAAVFGARDDDAMGRVFVLDMGDPVKIVDLARQMIHLAGLKPDVDIQIEFTGLRTGEKLYEELLHSEEEELPTENKGIFLAAPRTGTYDEMVQVLNQLEEHTRARKRADTLKLIQDIVPEYEADIRTLNDA